MTGYCGKHGQTYQRSEGCPGCREMSIITLVNRVYDRHVPREGK